MDEEGVKEKSRQTGQVVASGGILLLIAHGMAGARVFVGCSALEEDDCVSCRADSVVRSVGLVRFHFMPLETQNDRWEWIARMESV